MNLGGVNGMSLTFQEYEQMKDYRPFGKAGAGAPNYQTQHNRKKFTELDMNAQLRALYGMPITSDSEDEEVLRLFVTQRCLKFGFDH